VWQTHIALRNASITGAKCVCIYECRVQYTQAHPQYDKTRSHCKLQVLVLRVSVCAEIGVVARYLHNSACAYCCCRGPPEAYAECSSSSSCAQIRELVQLVALAALAVQGPVSSNNTSLCVYTTITKHVCKHARAHSCSQCTAAAQ
jgi:hypothetical protein